MRDYWPGCYVPSVDVMVAGVLVLYPPKSEGSDKMKKRLSVLLVGALMLALSAVPALAQGTPQGQLERGPDHANSICSFSGLNDTPDAEFPEGGQTQSYGQYVSQFAKIGVRFNADPGRATPGFACNGHLSPYPEAFPPPAP
jgi:hypothetical protein